ncbi:Sec-independent protein translocase protein TatB [Mesorhizobium sp. A623]
MFEVGWSEMLVIAVVMIVIVGPKDLPAMLRTFGRTVAKLRGMAGDFQKQFNDALKEAELDDVKKSVDSLRGLNPMTEIRKQLNPFEKAAADVRAGVDNVMKPKPAAAEATPAEPLKNGATELPGSDAPASTPAFPAMTDSSVVAEVVNSPVKKAAPKKTVKTAAPKAAIPEAAKAAPAKSTPVKASPAKVSPVKVAVKVAPAAEKPASTNRKLAEKPASTNKNPAEKPVPTNKKVAEKPAATKKKTAGTTK